MASVAILLFLLLFPAGIHAAEASGEEDAFNIGNAAAATSNDQKKIVSIVYDDSSSMSDGGSVNWAYANYAMQSFVALLGSQDKLYLTTTAAPSNFREITSKSRQQSINTIYSYYNAGSTFVESIDTAMGALKKNTDDGVYDYWLVVISDGQFYDKNYRRLNDLEFGELMAEQKAQVMPNGTSPKLVYIPIGDEPLKLTADPAGDTYVYPARDTDGIIASIIQSARIMSPRTQIEKASFAKVEKKDDRTIQITSKLPLKTLWVQSNKSDTTVASIKDSSGNEVDIGEKLVIQTPEHAGSQSDDTLKGRISTAGSQERPLPAGSYSVTFDKTVPSSISIYVEPAIELRLALFNGKTTKVLDDLEYVNTSQDLYARAELIDTGTGKALPAGSYFSSQTWSLMNQGDGQVLGKSTEKQLKSLSLKEGMKQTVSARVSLDDGAPLYVKIFLTPKKCKTYSMKWEIPEEGIQRTALMNNDQAYRLTILGDGKPLSGGEVKKLDLKLTVDAGAPGVTVTYLVNKDGSVSVKPNYLTDHRLVKGLISWLPTYTITPGEATLAASFTSKYDDEPVSGSEKMKIVREPLWRQIVDYVEPWILTAIVVGFVIKPRFPGRVRFYSIRLTEEEGGFYSGARHGWSRWPAKGQKGTGWVKAVKAWWCGGWRLCPYKAQRCVLDDVTILAQKKRKDGVREVQVCPGRPPSRVFRLRQFDLDSHRPCAIPLERCERVDWTPENPLVLTMGQALILVTADGRGELIGGRSGGWTEKTAKVPIAELTRTSP